MLGVEGQRRALAGLAQTSEDLVVLLHGKTELCRWPVDNGFPELNNRDAGNPGKGESVVTWRATLPASLTLGNVMDRVQVADRQGREVLMEPLPLPIHKEPGKALLVYINWHVTR